MSKENGLIKFLKKISNQFSEKLQLIISLSSNEKRYLEFEKYLKEINDQLHLIYNSSKNKKRNITYNSINHTLNSSKEKTTKNSTKNSTRNIFSYNYKKTLSNINQKKKEKEIPKVLNTTSNKINKTEIINLNKKNEKEKIPIKKLNPNQINLNNEKEKRKINTPEPRKKLNPYQKVNTLNKTVKNIKNIITMKTEKKKTQQDKIPKKTEKTKKKNISTIEIPDNNKIKQSRTIKNKNIEVETLTKLNKIETKEKNLRSKTPMIKPSEETALRIIKQFSLIKTIYRPFQPDDSELKKEINDHKNITKDNNLNKVNLPSNNNEKEIIKSGKIEKEIFDILNEKGNLFEDIYVKNYKDLKNTSFTFEKEIINNLEINHTYITYYEANYFISDEYRIIEYKINLEAKAEGNVYISKYSYPLDLVDDIDKIELIDFETSSKEIKCEISKEQPLICFSEMKLFNQQSIELKFKVKGIRKKKMLFYIRDYFYISKSSFGAACNVNIKLDNIIFVSSVNDVFMVDEDNTLFFKGNVPENGLRDILFLTKKSQRFKIIREIYLINNTNEINESSTLSLGKELQGDKEYYNLEQNNIKIYQDNNFKETIESPFKDKDIIKIPFSNVEKKIKLEIESIIENKFIKNYNNIPEEYNKIKISEEEKNFFSKISIDIIEKSDKKEPIPIKLARWVNENIKYDINYFSLEKTSKEIYIEKKGVCEHKSQLYKTLLNSIGIPSIKIGGFVTEETEKKCSPHAWCLVKYKNNWCAIDPTWKIYSGYLPLSHIFCYFQHYSIQVTGNGNKSLEIEFGQNQIEYLENK